MQPCYSVASSAAGPGRDQDFRRVRWFLAISRKTVQGGFSARARSKAAANADRVIVAAAIFIALVGAVFCAVVSRKPAYQQPLPPGAKVVEAKPETEA